MSITVESKSGTISKMVRLGLIKQLKEGHTVFKVTRYGSDRTTTYTIEGMQ
jgi:hypothetical protein